MAFDDDLFSSAPPAGRRERPRPRTAPDEVDDWLTDATPTDGPAAQSDAADLDDDIFVVDRSTRPARQSNTDRRGRRPAATQAAEVIWPEDEDTAPAGDDLFAAPHGPPRTATDDIFLTGDPGADADRAPRPNPLAGVRRAAAAAAAGAATAAAAARNRHEHTNSARPPRSARTARPPKLQIPAMPDFSRLRRDPNEPAPPVDVRRRVLVSAACIIVALVVLTIIGSARRSDTPTSAAAPQAQRPAQLVSSPTPAQRRRSEQQEQMAAATKRGDYDAAIELARQLGDTANVTKFQTAAATLMVGRASKAANRGDLPLASSRLKRAEDRYGRAPGADAVRDRMNDIAKARKARAKKRAAERRRRVAARRAAARRAAQRRPAAPRRTAPAPRTTTPAPRATPTPTPAPTPAPRPTPAPAPSPPSGGGSGGGGGGGGGGGAGEFF